MCKNYCCACSSVKWCPRCEECLFLTGAFLWIASFEDNDTLRAQWTVVSVSCRCETVMPPLIWRDFNQRAFVAYQAIICDEFALRAGSIVWCSYLDIQTPAASANGLKNIVRAPVVKPFKIASN